MLLNVTSFIRRKGFTPLRKAGLVIAKRWPWPVPVTLSGLSLYVDLRSSIGRALFIQGEFDPAVFIPFHEVLAPGDCFLDVGSNVGYYSICALEAVGPEGNVHAFDIDSRPLRCLYKTKKKNNLSNLFIHEYAVGDQEEMVGISKKSESGHTSIELNSAPSIEMTTLDALDETYNFGNVKGLKIDVEGSELRVLRGATRLINTHKPVIVCEVVDEHLRAHGTTVQDVTGYLVSAGYRFEWLEDVFSPAIVAYPGA